MVSSAGTKLGFSRRVLQALNHRTIFLVWTCVAQIVLRVCYVAEGDLELWNFQLHLWNDGRIGMHTHTWFWVLVRMEPRASCMADRHSTNGAATPPAFLCLCVSPILISQ